VGAHLSFGQVKVSVPWMLRPTLPNTRALVEAMVAPGGDVDPRTVEWFHLVARSCRITKAPAPLAGPELARWRDHPNHFVLGADDPFIRPDQVLAAARAVGVDTTHVTTLVQTGHLVPEERPEAVVDVLRGLS
jgi:pimeloyl-ACP methyl ester carboxylesterase